MSDGETPNSESGNDSNPTTKPTRKTLNKQRPNRLKIKACDLEIEAESHTENVEEMMEILAPEMEEVMEYHLVGDMAAIEERDLFAEIFGGNR